jgi:hypothetical protein
MPEEWKITLKNSSITLNEQLQNPQAVIDALDFYHHQTNHSLSKYMYPSDKNISLTPIIATPNIYSIEKSNHILNQNNLTNSVSVGIIRLLKIGQSQCLNIILTSR